MTTCRVAIIADDLTGALDAAAPFAARGAVTRVVVAPERLEAALAAWADGPPAVIAVNTGSRHLAPEEAAARVEQAARSLARVEPSLWFKKVDSTLRGQVVAESLALRRVIGRRLLLAPAVPAQGRTVRDAEVRVDGEPLAATAYGRDARSTPPFGPLDRLFADRGLPLMRHRPAAGVSLPASDCVSDAVTQADLVHLYGAMALASPAWLAVGAAGLATAMAQHLFGCLRARRQSLAGIERRLYAVGSCSPRSAEQLARLHEASPQLVRSEALSPETVSPPGTGSTHGVVVVPGPGSGAERPEAVAAAMAERVAARVAGWPDAAGLLLLTGGDIAMAVLDRLGIESLEVVGEWAPGVALGWLDGNPQRPVITKAGGFGNPDLLVALERTLAAGNRSARSGERPTRGGVARWRESG